MKALAPLVLVAFASVAVADEPAPKLAQSTTAPPLVPSPTYAPMPYAYTPPQMSRTERIAIARRHRNNGITLLAIGGAFLLASAPLFHEATVAHGNTNKGLWYGGAGSAVLIGLTLAIPGSVALAHWQQELNHELATPDDGAAARRAAIDTSAPPVAIGNALPGQLVLATPALRF